MGPDAPINCPTHFQKFSGALNPGWTKYVKTFFAMQLWRWFLQAESDGWNEVICVLSSCIQLSTFTTPSQANSKSQHKIHLLIQDLKSPRVSQLKTNKNPSTRGSINKSRSQNVRERESQIKRYQIPSCCSILY